MRRAGLLFFLSGFAGLTYQILWQRELGLLFGNTTQATATTLAVFFLGLAAGSWWFGRRAEGIPRPLRAFARLEWGIAAGALLLPLLLPLYRSLFAPLHGAVGSLPAVYAAVKFLLACLVLGPPAFLMGGTLPVLAELGTRAGQGLGRAAGRLYTWNTAGAVAGAFAAGFLLPRALGYRTTYAIALGVSLLVGVQAWLASRGETAPTPEPADPEPAITEAASPMRAVLVLAALSGFVSLAREVLWTRIFALVFINSV